jgi:hypothetical protein
MTVRPKLIFASMLGVIPLWLLAALLHVVDVDVDGILGLAAPNVLFSVTFLAALLAMPALLSVMAFLRARRRGYAMGLLIVSGVTGLVAALGGSTATTVGGWLVSIGGMTLVCVVVFSVATLPTVLTLYYRSGDRPAQISGP